MALDPNAPKGFAGLNDLASDIDALTPASVPAPPQPARHAEPLRIATPTPTPLRNISSPVRRPTTGHVSTAPARPIQPGDFIQKPKSGGIPGWGYLVGLLAIIGAAAFLIPAADKNIAKPSAASQASSYSTPAPVAPSKPSVPVTKVYYKVRGNDGNTFEIEGPPNATAEQINSIARSRWVPTETYVPEERPSVGDGLVFNDNQIRYCLSQKRRLSSWNTTVDSYSNASVDGFKEAVRDFNSRCSHYKYHSGALERVQREVDERWSILDADGRAHRGPRPPPSPPTYKKLSSRVVTTGGEQSPSVSGKHTARCAGSYEPAKCEALEAKLASETFQQAQERRQRLEHERQQNMSVVNER